jgi:hypothetical protein
MKPDKLNNALAWMCLSYPLMPLGVLCGLALCQRGATDQAPLYAAGLCLYYTLLSSSLWRCLRCGGGWLFGVAFLPLALHLLAAAAVLHIWTALPEGLLDIFLLGAVPMISALVGLAAMRLAFQQERTGWMIALSATVLFQVLAACAPDGLLRMVVFTASGGAQRYLLVFMIQAVLLWQCRRGAPAQDGVGLTAAELC